MENRPKAALEVLADYTDSITNQDVIGMFYQVANGTAGLHQLGSTAFELWCIAYNAGEHAQHIEIARLQHECDRLWLAAFAPKDRRDYLIRRLDDAFTLADRADVPTLDALLAEAWAIYCNSLDSVRQGVAI